MQGRRAVFEHPDFVVLRWTGLAALVLVMVLDMLSPIAAFEGAWALGPAGVTIFVLGSIGGLLPPLLLFTMATTVAVDADSVKCSARTLFFIEFDVRTAAVSQVDFVILDASSRQHRLAIVLRGGGVLVEWGRPVFGGEAKLRDLGVRWALALRTELRTVPAATKSACEGQEHR